MAEHQPPRRARVRCSGCAHEYRTWWTPIRTVYSDEVTREERAAASVVVCPQCGHRDRIGRNLALHGDVFRETTPADSWGAVATPDELQAYITELRALQALPWCEVERVALSDRDGVPSVEVVFQDQRVPGVAFGYRSLIWDDDPFLWWVNFMEDAEAGPARAREHHERPSEIVWLS
jgi:DNA-directed RNA polymerase subunit RPC12/RpoP